MPAAVPFLPLDPPEQWTKPTIQNTHNGKTYKPTHPDLVKVVFSAISPLENESADSEEAFSSALIAVTDIPPNSTITPLRNLSQAPVKAYSSVQYGTQEHEHFELNSDLLLMNHSCDPTAYVSLPKGRPDNWALLSTPKGLKKGEAVTFFYPSTEWDMAQGFKCSCGSEKCLGEIKGAKYLTMEELEGRGLVNDHIRALKEEQAKEQ